MHVRNAASTNTTFYSTSWIEDMVSVQDNKNFLAKTSEQNSLDKHKTMGGFIPQVLL